MLSKETVRVLHRLEDKLLSPESFVDPYRRKLITAGIGLGALATLGGIIGFVEWSKKFFQEAEETPSWQKEPTVISLIKEAKENGIIPVKTGHLLEMDNIVLINNTSHLLIGLNPEGSSLLLDDPRLIKAKTLRAAGEKIIFMIYEEASSPFPNVPRGWMVELRAGQKPEERKEYFQWLEIAKNEGLTDEQIQRATALSDSREFSAHFAAKLVYFCQTGETEDVPPELLNEFMSKPLNTIFPVYFLAYDKNWLNQP